MKKIILLLALVLMTTSFAKMNGRAFRIMGTAVGLVDSTLIYLDDITTSNGMCAGEQLPKRILFKVRGSRVF